MLEVTLFGLLLHRLSASSYERWEKPLTGRLCSRKDKNISDLLSSLRHSNRQYTAK
jgi:hypothetical protein